MLNAQITVNEAAREAARAVSLGYNPDDVDDVGAALGVVPGPIDWCTAGNLNATVEVTYEFNFVTPFAALANFAGGSFELTGKGVMPCRA
jgi:hypothetical protein